VLCHVRRLTLEKLPYFLKACHKPPSNMSGTCSKKSGADFYELSRSHSAGKLNCVYSLLCIFLQLYFKNYILFVLLYLFYIRWHLRKSRSYLRRKLHSSQHMKFSLHLNICVVFQHSVRWSYFGVLQVLGYGNYASQTQYLVVFDLHSYHILILVIVKHIGVLICL
jgi:hypothetical protein